MWRFALLACVAAAIARGQSSPSQLDFANLREDVRGLTQRVGDLSLRVEQLERENNELRQRVRATASDSNYVTLVQLNAAIDDLNRSLRSAVVSSKEETLQVVAAQMEKLAKQTNAALDSIAQAQATVRPVVQAPSAPAASESGKERTLYTVQRGDTLARIAKKTGVREQDIIAANKLTDPSRIVVGQTLSIPIPPTSTAK